MPIYEYECPHCYTRWSVLTRSWRETVPAVCANCGSPDVERLVSRFALHRSAGSIQERAGDPQQLPGADYYSDPRNIGRWTEKRFAEMGLAVPPEVRHSIDVAREGEVPDSMKELL